MDTTFLQAGQGYPHYRIPGTICSKKGTLFLTAEARLNLSDWSPMDIILMRSDDYGNTWNSMSVLYNGIYQNITANNPTLLVTKNNDIYLFYCIQYGINSMNGGVFYKKSTNDGLTWSSPVEISSSCMPDQRVVIATGPTHGIETSSGILLIPVWMVPIGNTTSLTSHHPSIVSTLYSLDQGSTWHMGECITTGVINPSETIITELSTGQIMLNMRNETGHFCRAITVSDTGYSHWSPVFYDNKLIEPICNASMINYNKNTLLFVNPSHKKERVNGTIRVSFDDGKTWPFSHTFQKGYAGYSDICVTPDGKIHIFMETDPLFSISHFQLTLNDITK